MVELLLVRLGLHVLRPDALDERAQVLGRLRLRDYGVAALAALTAIAAALTTLAAGALATAALAAAADLAAIAVANTAIAVATTALSATAALRLHEHGRPKDGGPGVQR